MRRQRHHAIYRKFRARFDDGREFRLLLCRQTWLWAACPIIQKPIGALFVEAMNPVAQRLPIHTANPG
jgi:hypothetical protein